jgi:putative ABC transport system ATP-binding protein
LSAVLQLVDLRKNFGANENLVKALDGVSLSIADGEFVAIVGTSGSGKSTLLHMMGGLDHPTSGSILINNNELAQMTADQLTIFRRRQIGFVFQTYNLISMLNVWENIVLPLRLDGNNPDADDVNNIIALLNLKEKINSLPHTLSGGQQQRVAIARALVTKPAIILADEPTGNLDSRTSQDVLGLLQASNRQFNQTMVIVTHNNEIAQLADRIIRLEDGRIVE